MQIKDGRYEIKQVKQFRYLVREKGKGEGTLE